EVTRRPRATGSSIETSNKPVDEPGASPMPWAGRPVRPLKGERQGGTGRPPRKNKPPDSLGVTRPAVARHDMAARRQPTGGQPAANGWSAAVAHRASVFAPFHGTFAHRPGVMGGARGRRGRHRASAFAKAAGRPPGDDLV